MPGRYAVVLKQFEVLRELEGARGPDDYRTMLVAMEYGDTKGLSDSDLHEMCLLSLQELSPEDAATVVLQHGLGAELREGQIRNLASEMQDEKQWEHYADMSLHERLFNAGSFLYEAFPGNFPEPDAVRVTFDISATNAAAEKLLSRPLTEPFLVRLLADGMEDNALLRRIFEEQLKEQCFPEAETIIWTFSAEIRLLNTVHVRVTGSGYWLDALRETASFDSAAHA